MLKRLLRHAIVLALCLCGWPVALAAEDDDRAAFFEKHVRPLLINRCYECHANGEGRKVKGGLLLDSREGWETGGESGPTLIPGKVSESLIMKAVRYGDPELQMPPKKKLAASDIAILERWVREGAYDPREGTPRIVEEKPVVDMEEERTFWSFQPLVDPPVPRTDDSEGWAKAPLDAFLSENWRKRGVTPATAVGSDKWTRRLAIGLTGLPPALLALPEDEQDRPDARERLVDRLLASPRYGERWGRHWLDIARYADSNGMDENMAYTEAYRYRDYVIDAFNQDLPFDEFVVEQLAGDLLEQSQMTHKVATGFLSVGPKMLACDDPQKMRMDIVDEQIDTMGRAFLGMTFGCARCHDHKFDPISIHDYYGLAGIFMSTKTLVNYKVVAKWHEYDLSPPEVLAAHEELDKLRKQAGNKKAKKSDREAAKEQLKAQEAKISPRTRIMGVTENEITSARVHLRGSYQTLGDDTDRQAPVVFHRNDQPIANAPADQSGRLQLARWIADPSNPLTARVMVNRLWRWHFGKGIVTSTDNFGKLGSPPRDADLLDHLANELVHGDWSVKRLQRLLTTSARYTLSTDRSGEDPALDPNQHLPAYQGRRRLDAESLRDSLLGLSAQLDFAMRGQLLKDKSGTYVDRGRLNEYLEIPRRAVYMPIVRSAVYDAFVAFDMADPSTPNGDRRESVVAPQALYLMNSERVHQAAQAIAGQLPEETDLRERLARLYQMLLHRDVTTVEVERARQFLETYSHDHAWVALVRVLLASNEFLHLD